MSLSTPSIEVFTSLDALTAALRLLLLQKQSVSIQTSGTFKIALSAGAVPETVAAATLSQHHKSNDDIQFHKWEIFLADERAVPLDHVDSNYGFLKRALLDKIPGASKPRIHPLKTAYLDDLPKLAKSYEAALSSTFACSLPTFDLIILGCGPDGHICSLFPGHALLQESTAWVAPISDSPKEPPRRITLTFPVLKNASHVAFVVLGLEKKDTMMRVFNPSSDLPASQINRALGNRVTWFMDDAASAGLGTLTM